MSADDLDIASFESSSASGSGGLNSMLAPLAVGLTGVLLGGVALYFSLTGSGRTTEAQSALEAITAKADGLETRIRDLETKFSEIASEQSALQERANLITRDVQQALNQVGVEINRNRKDLGETTDKLTELIETLNRSGKPSTAAATATNDAAARLPVATVAETEDASAPVSVGNEREHIIRSGDTFTKLAERYQVSVSAILAANPDVDPRRLRVGQKIKIPTPQP